tara:strand:- start:4509 stop:5546 length:1038 start_codon:yes stop_codon:yes gene_type:complete
LNSKNNLPVYWLFIVGLIFLSCEESVDPEAYDPTIVVFGNLNAYAPVIDTFFVSWSYSFDQPHEAEENWIDSAEVFLFTNEDTIPLVAADIPGRYIDSTYMHIIEAGKTYHLKVIVGNDSVISTTTVPDTLSLSSIEWIPPASEEVCTDTVPANNNLFNTSGHTFAELLEILLNSQEYIGGDSTLMETFIYKEGDCYTTYFGSTPMFNIEWSTEIKPGMVRTVSLALDDTVSNAIVDTSFPANAFKGPMYQDENGFYYRPNPFAWNLNQSPLQFGWLFFNYYGVHLILVQATDQAFSDYFGGDPMQYNPYIPPFSNIEGGYGLFSSVSTKFFLVNIIPDSTAETP